jgi:uncharacterized protein YggE
LEVPDSEDHMNRFIPAVAFVFLVAGAAKAQAPEARFVADTVVVQAEGSFESDPDLGTLTFDVSSQDKDLKTAYDKARQSAQRVVDLAEKNGLKKDDVTLGILTMTPTYDRKNRAKSYSVNGQITLSVHDFAMLGPILDGAIEEVAVEFRSMTYSLADEEAAKERAVAAAMHSAVGRASAALGQSGQTLGAVRYANIDVKQIAGMTRLQSQNFTQLLEVTSGVSAEVSARTAAQPPPSFPALTPEKITVSATVQCAFQIL